MATLEKSEAESDDGGLTFNKRDLLI